MRNTVLVHTLVQPVPCIRKDPQHAFHAIGIGK
jgi:hypothetical protein